MGAGGYIQGWRDRQDSGAAKGSFLEVPLPSHICFLNANYTRPPIHSPARVSVQDLCLSAAVRAARGLPCPASAPQCPPRSQLARPRHRDRRAGPPTLQQCIGLLGPVPQPQRGRYAAPVPCMDLHRAPPLERRRPRGLVVLAQGGRRCPAGGNAMHLNRSRLNACMHTLLHLRCFSTAIILATHTCTTRASLLRSSTLTLTSASPLVCCCS